MDIALTLEIDNYQYSGSVRNNTKEEYQAITWLDARTKPTWQELKDLAVASDIENIKNKDNTKQDLRQKIADKGTIELINILIAKNIIKKNDFSQNIRDLIDQYNAL